MVRHTRRITFRHCLLSLCFVGIGFVSFQDNAQARIKYGLWEITVTVKMDGMPTDNPSEVFQKCINRNNLTPGNNTDKDGCDKDKVNRKGDTVNWTVNCAKDKHTLSGSGLVVYSDTTMSGHAEFQAGGKELATMNMKLQYNGKYMGKCKK